jgi:hypothetical protein
MIQKWVLLDVEMDQRKQVIDQLFFMLLSGKILFCDSESESNSDESVLTIPVGEFQR